MECLLVKKKKGKQATKSGVLVQATARHRLKECDPVLFIAAHFFYTLHNMGITTAGGTPYPAFDQGRNSGWYKDYLLHHARGRKIAFAPEEWKKTFT